MPPASNTIFPMYYKGKLQYAAGGIILKTDRTDRKKRQKNSSETV